MIAEGSISFLPDVPVGIIAYEREFEGKRLLVMGNMTGEATTVACAHAPQKEAILIQNYADLPICRDAHISLRSYELLALWI